MDVYAQLSYATTLMGKKETDLRTVYELLQECDRIVTQILSPRQDLCEPLTKSVSDIRLHIDD
jgi:hypothetical protein